MAIFSIRTATMILVATISIGFASAALQDPFSISWKLINRTFSLNGPFGYAVSNDVGYLFGRTEIPVNVPLNARYNFTDGTWTSYPSLATPSAYPCVVPLPNGDIYVMGGAPWNVQIGVPYNTVYKLAAGANNYTTMAPMNEGRMYHGCTYDASTNRIYAIGGNTQDGNGLYSILRTGEYYSIEHNNWTMMANRSDNVYQFSVVNIGDGNIYIFNGVNVPQTVRQYSIADDTWTTIGTLPKANSAQLAVYYAEENIIFLWGGHSANNDGCQYFNMTSKTAVAFDCLDDFYNVSITDETIVGAFVASTRTFYAASWMKGALWSATMPMPPAAPTATPVTSAPVASAPVSGPTSDATPTSAEQPTRSPTKKSISEAIRSTSAHGMTFVLIAAVALMI